MTTPEQNKQIVRDYVKAFNAGDFAVVAQLFAPDGIIHGVLGQGGLDVAMPVWNDLHAAFGLTLEIEELVAEGDVVAVRYTERGTMRGPFRGMAATGKSYTLTAMEFFRFADGKIIERWGARDSASMMRQLGLTAL